ncbi:MAG TPA: nucleotidyltransferase domain-containing protein [Stellaceae bacterium]|jgi:predicted nucleotidyltransferase|nr:nucleotidyltransferase domain-containing protein [Stellaceae bacterium]
MNDTIARDPVLGWVRTALDALYGERIERVVLFGSQARGDHTEDSDYDVAVFLHGLTDRWAELRRLADLRTRMLGETGVFLDIKPFPAGSYIDRTSIMREIRLDGLDL